jgi:hypothetical protein
VPTQLANTDLVRGRDVGMEREQAGEDAREVAAVVEA